MPCFTTEDGCRIYYETHGFDSSRPLVVFLNGTMQNTVNWANHCNAFKKQFRVLLYDSRAQGQSDLGERQLSLELHTGDLAALLAHLALDRAHLVGLSHGAKVALAYAANFPGRVDRLVLCSVGDQLTCRAELTVRSWARMLRSNGLEEMAWLAVPSVFGEVFLRQNQRTLNMMVKALVVRNKKQYLIAHLEAMTAYPRLSQIARDIDVACLVISASDDPLVTRAAAEKLAKLCNGRHKQMTGIGHTVPVEAPELFAKTVLGFLSEK